MKAIVTERMPHTRPFAPVLLVVFPLVVACGNDATAPARPNLAPNTMTVRVTGAGLSIDKVAPTVAGFQRVTTGVGEGLHIQAVDVAGLGVPLAIHLPSRPGPGLYTLGRWDPTIDGVRSDTVLYVGRKPAIAFGTRPAASFGAYTSRDGGTVEIDSITLPADRAFTESGFPNYGSIRGRLHTRAVGDTRLASPGQPPRADTIDITAEFRADLENWPDGRGKAAFAGGSLAGLSAPAMRGSGSVYYYRELTAPPMLLVSLTTPAGDPNALRLWFGTKLRGPGRAALDSIGSDDVNDLIGWPRDRSHFVAGTFHGRPLVSINGTIDLEAYDEYGNAGWGEAKGHVVATLEVQGSAGRPAERTSVDLTFHVPVGFFIVTSFGSPQTDSRRPPLPALFPMLRSAP